MKFLFMFLTFVGISVSSVAKESERNIFLSQQELLSLSQEQRGRYFREVQRILAAMAQQSLYLSENESQSQERFPANVDQLTSPDALLEKTYKDAGKGQGFKIRLQGEPAPTNINPNPTPVVVTPVRSSQIPRPAPQPSPSRAQNTESSSVTVDAKEVEIENSRPNFRCMYAGWVIPEDPCVGHTRFPRYYSIQGTDSKKMVCLDGKTMCNPTVFGLRLPKNCKKLQDCANQATPICVNRGAWPTVECYHSSTYENALVAAEINTEINPQHYQTYSKVFRDLCDPEQIAKNPYTDPNRRKVRKNLSADAIRNDIRITCAWAEKKLRQVRSAISEGSSYTLRKWEQQQKQGSDEMGRRGQK